MHTTVYEIDKHQEPTIQDRELYSISYNKLYGKESEKEYISMGLSDGSAVKNPPAMQETQCEFSPWVRKSPWRRKCQPTPVLPGESDGQRNLAVYSPWVAKSQT